MSNQIVNRDFEEDESLDEPVQEKHVLLDFVVEKGQEPLRIDKYLMSKIAGITRSTASH
jgi:hypothetical protein